MLCHTCENICSPKFETSTCNNCSYNMIDRFALCDACSLKFNECQRCQCNLHLEINSADAAAIESAISSFKCVREDAWSEFENAIAPCKETAAAYTDGTQDAIGKLFSGLRSIEFFETGEAANRATKPLWATSREEVRALIQLMAPFAELYNAAIDVRVNRVYQESLKRDRLIQHLSIKLKMQLDSLSKSTPLLLLSD